MAANWFGQVVVALFVIFCHFGSTEAFELNFDSTEGILAIVGIIVGGVLILAILIACCCYCSKSGSNKRPPPTVVVNSASSDKSHVIASTQFGPPQPYNGATVPNNNISQLSNSSMQQQQQRASSPPVHQPAAPINYASQIPVPQQQPQLQPLSVAHPPTTMIQQQQPPTPQPQTPQPTSPVQQQQINRLSYTQQAQLSPIAPASQPQSPRTPEPAQQVQRGPSFANPPILERNQDRSSARLPKNIYKNPFGFPEDNFVEDLLIVELKTKLPPKQPYLGQNYTVNSEPYPRESWQQDERMRSHGSRSPSLPRPQSTQPHSAHSGYGSDAY